MEAVRTGQLRHLQPGQAIVFGGDRVTYVGEALAAAFAEGDRLIVDQTTGALLHVPAAEQAVATAAVDAGVAAFAELARCSDDQISRFFTEFADRLADDACLASIVEANRADIETARRRGRSTTRLELSTGMRAAMIEGLRCWAASELRRDVTVSRIDHEAWDVEARKAPLGVVGFVFEGRPNVFADAAGVLRTGNTVVFRIGSDALGTAKAINEFALRPALAASGLPAGAVVLVESASHAAGWALFADRRLALAVGRGSGPAVAQLGAVARQSGVAVSLHGTGGAWLVAAPDADRDRLAASVVHSLDRKVCNTLNVCCIVESRAPDLVPVFVDCVRRAGERRGAGARLHVTERASKFVPVGAFHERSRVVRADGEHDEPFASAIATDRLGHEWEWEESPEVTLHVVADVDTAVELCNAHSPRFVASLISESPEAHARFFATVDAPFVGDGFTRWVDGQYALGTPELGLTNWEHGRTLARGGILSGDSVHTIRYRASVRDPGLHR